MEVCSEWEIYIPMEAEVINIPPKSLPDSVLRRIGLPVSDSDSSRKSTDSLDVIWICPVVIGRKGQGSASCKGRNLAENTLAFLGTEFQAGPLKMSFVSSNRAARDVLKNISAGKCLSKKKLLHQDSALPANQNAVVIYNGQIYLCIRKARRRQQKTRELQLSSDAAIPSTSGLRSTSSTKELNGGRQKIKVDTGKVKGCEKSVELKRKGGSADRAEYLAPCPSDSGHKTDSNSRYFKAARKELASEETALQPSYVQRQEKQEHPTNRVVGEYMNNLGEEECSVWTNDMDRNQMDRQNDERAGSNGLMMTKSLGAAGASTSKHMDIDFNELEQQEKIAQLKAKFMQNEAALNDLLS